MSQTSCRFCSAPLEAVFADLGMSPLANSYLPPERVNAMEPFYPLRALVCGNCFLVQLEEFETPQEIFSDYAYFSSYSSSWLDHSRRYAEQMTGRLGLDSSSHVVEIASNDGYLLQFFHERQIPVLGIEPAANVAKVALQKGIPTLVEFFGVKTASSLAVESAADLLLGNNVLAHVPDLNDFVAGMKVLLKPGGVITMEFPHLMRLIGENQWDTIYHEHFSYLSLHATELLFGRHGLVLFDVDELPTHGGSLRIYAQLRTTGPHAISPRVEAVREAERRAGLLERARYDAFGEQVIETKRKLLELLIPLKRAGKRIAAYGAPAKGNTLLNYCGIRRDFIDFTVDSNPHKQGRLLPGTRIPIFAPDKLLEERPDFVLVLPWNIADEIFAKMAGIAEWGGRFIVPIPTPRII
jgi:SAM-dependent methyltransferase